MQDPREERFDPYAILSLQPEAPQQLIDEAYWLLARLARDRLAPGPAAKRIGELTAAYEMISNGERRREYHQRAGLPLSDATVTLAVENKILEFPSRDGDVGPELFTMLRIAPDAD